MTEDENYFRKWFVDVLEPLRDKGDAGFVFAVVSLPLLERYLREKSDAGQASTLPQEFFDELGALFPDIAGKERDFWHCYRNGLLHQAAFSKAKIGKRIEVMSNAALSGYDIRPVYFDISSDTFYLNPMTFFDRVTTTILSDFATYMGSLSPAIGCREKSLQTRQSLMLRRPLAAYP